MVFSSVLKCENKINYVDLTCLKLKNKHAVALLKQIVSLLLAFPVHFFLEHLYFPYLMSSFLKIHFKIEASHKKRCFDVSEI